MCAIIQAEISNDSLAVLIEEGKVEILAEVLYTDPLIDKYGGIEVNPLYTMIYSDDGFSFSGTVSIFPENKNIEIAFPVAYKSLEGFTSSLQATFRVDAQYRYFLGKHRKGIYIMTGMRHASFKGDTDNWYDDYDGDYTRQGISFGVGFRIFAQSGFYWGTSLYGGKYYFGGNLSLDEDLDKFMNFEFFKFGKTF